MGSKQGCRYDGAMRGAGVQLSFYGWDLLGHLGFFLEAISFLFTEIVHLRICYAVANTLLVVYALLSLGWPEGVTTLIWSAALALVNMVQLMRIWWNQYATLSEDENVLWRKCFANMNQADFRVLYKKGQVQMAKEGQLLLQHGQEVTDLMVVLNGEVAVVVGEGEGIGMRVASLRNYSFIGDQCVLTNDVSTATYSAVKTTKYIKWSRMTLENMTKRDAR